MSEKVTRHAADSFGLLFFLTNFIIGFRKWERSCFALKMVCTVVFDWSIF